MKTEEQKNKANRTTAAAHVPLENLASTSKTLPQTLQLASEDKIAQQGKNVNTEFVQSQTQLPAGPALQQPQQLPYAPGYKAAETPEQAQQTLAQMKKALGQVGGPINGIDNNSFDVKLSKKYTSKQPKPIRVDDGRYRGIVSKRTDRYARPEDHEVPWIDHFTLSNEFYVIENYGKDGFNIWFEADAEEFRDAIDVFKEVIDNDPSRAEEIFSRGSSYVWSWLRKRGSDYHPLENGRTGGSNDLVVTGNAEEAHNPNGTTTYEKGVRNSGHTIGRTRRETKNSLKLSPEAIKQNVDMAVSHFGTTNCGHHRKKGHLPMSFFLWSG